MEFSFLMIGKSLGQSKSTTCLHQKLTLLACCRQVDILIANIEFIRFVRCIENKFAQVVMFLDL